jgi:hypothetical protein
MWPSHEITVTIPTLLFGYKLQLDFFYLSRLQITPS